MLGNNTYNLMSELVEVNRSLWRIKNQYRKDANESRCGECINFWKKLENDLEQRGKELEDLIKEHLK